ncbi:MULTISPECIES: YlxR family protein [unclassified Streptomyces]|uniref:YlxR family protein n=1 Tax=unclassified Streptomyces TaxID=2593676 RepID=UPI0022B64C31|nr:MULTISPECIES: YlxR family protein [unclassified Streptomyces]MCZ7416207.1 YlxR family protein [Streptomyces sp. WMMC897]MCZ7433984.1 YlxR family protein [Streptomyces sp. WMMC1477]
MSGRTRARACPERTCVGCRGRSVKADLLRVVLIEGECVPDLRGTLPGRGAYLHPSLACLDLAVRRRAFPRAFRATVGRRPLGTEELGRHVRQASRETGDHQHNATP